MSRAEELKKITREVLGESLGVAFYAKADKMLEEAEATNSALLQAARGIERMVKLFVDVESAKILGGKYKEFFRKNPSYL